MRRAKIALSDTKGSDFMLTIRAPKELWSGLIYIALAGAFLWFGREYKIGTSARMGPGFFPFYLSLCLLVLGLIATARAFVIEGEAVESFAWRSLALVLSSCVAFGLLIKGAGLVIALTVLCLLSAAASAYFKITTKALAGLFLLVLFCTLIFIKGLGVPMPIFGAWFGDALPAWLIR
jgi:hypothetical protein